MFLGKSVSLDCENKLLELTGYYGAQKSDDGGDSVRSFGITQFVRYLHAGYIMDLKVKMLLMCRRVVLENNFQQSDVDDDSEHTRSFLLFSLMMYLTTKRKGNKRGGN